MKTLSSALILALALALVGCGSKEEPKDASPKGGGVSTGTTGGNGPTVPEELKTAAYEYYGLGHSELMTYTVQLSEAVGTQEGTQTIELQEVKDGAATYQIERTGALADLGTETMRLDKAGVSTIASSKGLVKTPSLEMPADIAVGKEWEANMVLEIGAMKVDSHAKSKATQETDLVAGGETYRCIVVESNMDATISGSPNKADNGKATTTFKAYYAKGVGLVKMESTIKKPNGETVKLKIELQKVGEEAAETGSGQQNP